MKYLKLLVPALVAGSLTMAAQSAVFAQSEMTTVRTTTTTTSTPYVLPSTSTYVVVDPITGEQRGVYDPMQKATFAVAPGLVVIDNSSNQAVATFDSSGNVIALTSAPVFDPLLSSIDARRLQFDTMIKDLKVRGGYDEATILGLASDLERINAQESAYRASGRPLTYAEELSLAVQLNALGDRITPFSRTVTITPLIGSRFVSTDGQIVLVDSFGGRNLTMQRRIDAEYAAGRLSNNQVARLKEELNDVASLQAKYTKGGKIKDGKQRLLTEKLDRVQTDMDKDIASINEKRARIGIKVN
ncbi:MAG: hypothetical protein KGS72_11365 [Cyanobacteria bacterium REEB67]|nr:hypothetical protein [Cyanobacteria bacterium REEB67]